MSLGRTEKMPSRVGCFSLLELFPSFPPSFSTLAFLPRLCVRVRVFLVFDRGPPSILVSLRCFCCCPPFSVRLQFRVKIPRNSEDELAFVRGGLIREGCLFAE